VVKSGKESQGPSIGTHLRVRMADTNTHTKSSTKDELESELKTLLHRTEKLSKTVAKGKKSKHSPKDAEKWEHEMNTISLQIQQITLTLSEMERSEGSHHPTTSGKEHKSSDAIHTLGEDAEGHHDQPGTESPNNASVGNMTHKQLVEYSAHLTSQIVRLRAGGVDPKVISLVEQELELVEDKLLDMPEDELEHINLDDSDPDEREVNIVERNGEPTDHDTSEPGKSPAPAPGNDREPRNPAQSPGHEIPPVKMVAKNQLESRIDGNLNAKADSRQNQQHEQHQQPHLNQASGSVYKDPQLAKQLEATRTKLVHREEKLSTLDNDSESMKVQADEFRANASALRKKKWGLF